MRLAENAWKPMKRSAGDNGDDEDENLLKKFRGILNKLTPEKFDTLLNQVKALEINSVTRLSEVTSLVLEKALNDTHFAFMYAKLCNTLLRDFPIVSKRNSHTVNFRQMLLQKCQQEFEKDTDACKKRDTKLRKERRAKLEACGTDDARKVLQEQFGEADSKAKRRSLGLMRFIGELYNLSILSFPILHDCFLKLMKQSSDEASIVCACKLLTTVGKKVTAECNDKKSKSETAKTKESESTIFRQYLSTIYSFILYFISKYEINNKPRTSSKKDSKLCVNMLCFFFRVQRDYGQTQESDCQQP